MSRDVMPVTATDWPARWRLQFTWQRLYLGVILALLANIVLAIAGLDAARHASALTPLFIGGTLLRAAGEEVGKSIAMPLPERSGLPARARATEALMILTVAALWSCIGLANRAVPGVDHHPRNTALFIATGLICTALVLIRPSTSWSRFAAAEQQSPDDDEPSATTAAVLGLIACAVAGPIIWIVLVERVYPNGDHFDHTVVPPGIAVGFLFWAFLTDRRRRAEARAEAELKPPRGVQR